MPKIRVNFNFLRNLCQRAAADTEKIPHNTFFFVIRFRYNIDVVLLRFQMIHAQIVPVKTEEAAMLPTPDATPALVLTILEDRDAMVGITKMLVTCMIPRVNKRFFLKMQG